MEFISKLFFAIGGILLILLLIIFLQYIRQGSEIFINPRVLSFYRYWNIFIGVLMLIGSFFGGSITAHYLSKK